VQLRLLGRGGSDLGACPSLYLTDKESYLVQGWETESPETIEIPHLLVGYAEPDTFIGSTMTDTGRGTFTLTGRAVAEREILDQLDLAPNETAIEVPKTRRTFYGALSSA
jgi:hypothetical protein